MSKEAFQIAKEALEALYKDTKDMSEKELQEYRKHLVDIGTTNSKELGATSKKEYLATDNEVVSYVSKILEDGFNLKQTNLSFNSKFIDVQQTTRYKEIIKDCVQRSSFSGTMFKHKALLRQRSNIEKSNTLHELRQNTKDMIGPLRMLKDSALTTEYKTITEDELIVEIEQLKWLVADQRRVIDELTAPYDVCAEPAKMEGQYLLDCVEELKSIYSISDTEACKRLEVSRSTLARTRKELNK